MSASARQRDSTSQRLADLLIGDSGAMVLLRQQVERAARTPLPVLIEGPSGAGKELVAQGLHIGSGRSGRFVALNVCAISDGLFEDAMFGHVRGAFSGAVASNAGYCEEASGGSLFLDEIGALGLAHQSKLLRVVETKSYRKVGAAQDRHSDFRLISASNISLQQLVRTSQFRNDLLHRLAGIVIRVPGLDEHREDIPQLVRHFAAKMVGFEGAGPSFTSNAMAAFVTHGWSGNVRELKVAIERTVAFAESSRIDIAETRLALEGSPGTTEEHDAPERRRVLEALIQSDWDTVRAASMLEINRSTLYRTIKRMRLRRGEALQLDVAATVQTFSHSDVQRPMRIRADSPSVAANARECAGAQFSNSSSPTT